MKEACIAVDAMGGEHSPESVVEGIRLLNGSLPVRFLLVGDTEKIEACGLDGLDVEVVHAEQIVDMSESPGVALKKKRQSSIAVAVGLVKEGKAQAIFSAGNTGAVMAFALFELGRLEGILRPTLAAAFPTASGPVVLVDVGANVDCKPQWLLQFGIMGQAYAEAVLQKENVRVGLLSIGEEPEKGNELSLQAYKLFQEASINFAGNVEGHDLPAGNVDVVVCDGFVGNVMLKFGEGFAEMILHTLRGELTELRERMDLGTDAVSHFIKQLDYAEYGAALLLGVNGNCLIGHGKSSARAVANALRQAYKSVHYTMNDRIVAGIKRSAGVFACNGKQVL